MRASGFVVVCVLSLAACRESGREPSSEGVRQPIPLSPTLRASLRALSSVALEARPDGARPAQPIRNLRVSVPARADGALRIQTEQGVAVGVRLVGATPAGLRVQEGVAVFAGATASGETQTFRATPEAIEDHLELSSARDVQYELDLDSGVEALRQIGDVLEVIGAGGVPRLRMLRPSVIDREGHSHAASVRLDGCAVDRDPRAPWGRAMTPPGAERCRITIRVPQLQGPLVLDPAWSATEAMSIRRQQHTATLLPTGKVLIAGGTEFETLATCELYDPATKTFAMTGSLAAPRAGHVAMLTFGDQVLIVGGNTTPNPEPVPVKTAELYQYGDGSFASASSTVALSGAGLFLVKGDLDQPWLLSGVGGKAEEFTAPYGPFTQRFTMPAGVPVSTEDGNIAFVSANNATVTSVNRQTGETTTLGPLQSALQQKGLPDPSFVRAIYNGNGTLTAVVGTCPDSPCQFYAYAPAQAEVFDLAAGTSRLVPLAQHYLFDHRLALLSPGHVLAINPQRPFSSGVGAQTELILTEPGVALLSGSMQHGRGQSALANLPDGTVLVSGGAPFDSSYPAFTSDLIKLVPDGGAAQQRGECSSTQLNDGICCQASCADPCQTCRAGTGACVPVKGVTDPKSCDGKNRCSLNAVCLLTEGQSCGGDTECASDHCIDGVCCDTGCSGTCESCVRNGSVGTCGAVAGEPAAGRGSCEGTGLCQGACDGVAPSCTFPDAAVLCGSSCEDAVLSPNVCDGAGECMVGTPTACGGGFTCADEESCGTSCDDDSGCVGGRSCNNGYCEGALGAPCVDAPECASGFCADGVCCDAECSGQCEACDGQKEAGHCAAAVGAPHGDREACEPGDAGCEATCNGSDTSACTFADRSRTCGADCADDLFTLSSCNGAGRCEADQARHCPGNFVCDDSSHCKSSCEQDDNCREGFACDVSAGVCVAKPVRCEGDAVLDSDNVVTSCVPYRCQDAACATSCANTEDCVAGFVCGKGECVQASQPAAVDDDGGCSIAVPKSRQQPLLPPLALLLLLGLRRRRGARQPSAPPVA